MSTSLYTSQAEILHKAANEALDSFNDPNIHRQGVCKDMAQRTLLRLMSHKIFWAERVEAYLPTYHRFVVVPDSDSGVELGIDPTWQQFFPRGVVVPLAPKTLIGSRHDIAEQALEWGVPERYAPIWTAARSIESGKVSIS